MKTNYTKYMGDIDKMSLKQMRAALGLTQMQLASKLSLPLKSIQVWENNPKKANPIVNEYLQFMLSQQK